MEEYDTKWLNIFSLSAVDGQKIENWILNTAEKHCDVEQGKSHNVPNSRVKAAVIRAVAEGTVRWLKCIKEHPIGK